jgi:hypothetical protein
MPLIQGKSKKAFSKNVEKEMDAGKPQPQSLAIAYNVKRKNEMKKKMAQGGAIAPEAKEERMESINTAVTPEEMAMIHAHRERMAAGGAVGVGFEKEMKADIDHPSSIAEAIMAKRKKMAEGGEVDLEDNAEEGRNEEDQLSYEALKKENYSEESALEDLDYDTDKSMGDASEDDEENKDDMVSALRKKIKYKNS